VIAGKIDFKILVTHAHASAQMQKYISWYLIAFERFDHRANGANWLDVPAKYHSRFRIAGCPILIAQDRLTKCGG
jgi:hypothetical protein